MAERREKPAKPVNSIRFCNSAAVSYSRCVAIQATALKLGFISQAEFDEVVDPAKWCTCAESLDWDVNCILKGLSLIESHETQPLNDIPTERFSDVRFEIGQVLFIQVFLVGFCGIQALASGPGSLTTKPFPQVAPCSVLPAAPVLPSVK